MLDSLSMATGGTFEQEKVCCEVVKSICMSGQRLLVRGHGAGALSVVLVVGREISTSIYECPTVASTKKQDILYVLHPALGHA